MVHKNYLDQVIRKVPDFPKKGILFYDITGILIHPKAFRYCIDTMAELYSSQKPDAVAAIEARGFIFAAPFAERLGLPLILVRKEGKLPGKTITKRFSLEYGEDVIQVHEADVPKHKKVLIVDDLIATGGTLRATKEMFEQAGAAIQGIFCVVGLPFLNYKKHFPDTEITTLIDYHGE